MEADSKKKDKDGTDIVGNIIKVKMAKSRFTKENKIVEVIGIIVGSIVSTIGAIVLT